MRNLSPTFLSLPDADRRRRGWRTVMLTSCQSGVLAVGMTQNLVVPSPLMMRLPLGSATSESPSARWKSTL